MKLQDSLAGPGHHPGYVLMMLFLLSLTSLPVAADLIYTMKDLGTLPGGSYSEASGINNHGQVVGVADLPPGRYGHAVLYENGTMVDLGTLPPSDAHSGSQATGINNRGQVAGTAFTLMYPSPPIFHAVLYANGDMTDQDMPSGIIDGFAYSVNDYGQAAGSVHSSGGGETAAMFEDSTVRSLGAFPGGTFSRAYGINDSGQAVGVSSNTRSSAGYPLDHAALFENGIVIDLGTLGGATSIAYSINNSGQIVGEADTASATHAFLYEQGVMTDLGTLGGSYSRAAHINNRGQIVGASTTANGETHAFLYEHGVMTDLGLAGNSSYAAGINDKGQVVGASAKTGDPFHAVLWFPSNVGRKTPRGNRAFIPASNHCWVARTC